jgi:AraC-like DNA-binding protein
MGYLTKIKLLNELRLTLKWIYEWNLPAEHELFKASFPSTVIWIVLAGNRKVMIGDVRYELKAGDIVIIPPLVPRTGFPEHDSYGPFHYITLAADIRLGSLDFVKLYGMPAVHHVGDPEAWSQIVEQALLLLKQTDRLLVMMQLNTQWEKDLTEFISELSTQQAIELLDVQRLFSQWFLMLCRLISPWMPEQPIQTDRRLSDLCAYIQSHIESSLTPSHLASIAFVSESHLRLLFRNAFGSSPRDYVLKARMKHARELLLNSDNSLGEIAERVGYDDVSKFSRHFSKLEGLSPREYRKQFQGPGKGQ